MYCECLTHRPHRPHNQHHWNGILVMLVIGVTATVCAEGLVAGARRVLAAANFDVGTVTSGP